MRDSSTAIRIRTNNALERIMEEIEQANEGGGSVSRRSFPTYALRSQAKTHCQNSVGNLNIDLLKEQEVEQRHPVAEAI